MITYVIPTRNRPERLADTLWALGALRGHAASLGAEIIVVDNASDHPPKVEGPLDNGIPVRLIVRTENEGAASRNIAVQEANPRSQWIVMLDDDSFPLDTGFLHRLASAPPDVAAVSADILLPHTGRREMGGLPAVFVGCGVAIRRSVFLELGGYDPAFNYYVEEYDLAARMLIAGYRVQFDRWFRVEHHKTNAGRDMNTILARLVRNNGWIIRRYAPSHRQDACWSDLTARYRQIAQTENALEGFERGLSELESTIDDQPRSPMTDEQFDRFIGLAQARQAIDAAIKQHTLKTAAIVDEGKHAWVVRQAMRELGLDEVPLQEHPGALVVGTMSPGPMLDAAERRAATAAPGSPPVVVPWRVIADQLRSHPDHLLTGGAQTQDPSATRISA
ncbi:MAG: glycosyltransferase [Planctomycetes bacterium]|nr:glycosyltransferase [Planctomycetota bacterium]